MRMHRPINFEQVNKSCLSREGQGVKVFYALLQTLASELCFTVCANQNLLRRDFKHGPAAATAPCAGPSSLRCAVKIPVFVEEQAGSGKVAVGWAQEAMKRIQCPVAPLLLGLQESEDASYVCCAVEIAELVKGQSSLRVRTRRVAAEAVKQGLLPEPLTCLWSS